VENPLAEREIGQIRTEIDRLDGEIVNLLNARAKLALEIGHLKKRDNKPPYVPEREKAVYRRLSALNQGPLPLETLKAVYRELMSGCLSLEHTVEVAYLGPEYSFSHLAAKRKFGSAVHYRPQPTIAAIFDEVAHGRVMYGVAPIENSTEGGISDTMDCLATTEARICAEIVVPVHLCLLSKSPKEKIKKIYSKPQALAQCRVFLATHMPGADLIDAASTTKAAEIAAQDETAAAVASAEAGEAYGLAVLAENIEDVTLNATRFLVIARESSGPSGDDRTSLMFSIKDEVGALFEMLEPFRKAAINLTRIESRPSKKRAWDYIFFVDLEGHIAEEKVKKAIAELEGRCKFVSVLGSYPVSREWVER
jgi:chorismate mutase / prephenate dehydratase